MLPLNAPGNEAAAASAAAPLKPAASDLALLNAPVITPPAVDAAPNTLGTKLVALAVTVCVAVLAELTIFAVPVPAKGVAAVTLATAAPADIFAGLPAPTEVVAVVAVDVVGAVTGVSALAVLVGLAPAAALPPLFTALSPVVPPKAAVDAPPPPPLNNTS